MTWSIVAHDGRTGAFAVAIATCAFAVGAGCPHVRSGVGAVSTQSVTNRYLGPAVLDAMARGLSPADAIESALAGDAGRGVRQVHAVDRHGRATAHTGANCVEWCGDRAGTRVSVAGNMLAGPAVIADTAAAYLHHADLPFARRLLAAMHAGEAAGGDKRGRQSAALLVQDGERYPLLDLRVDDHADPLAELSRLEAVARERWVHFRRHMPSRAAPAGLTDRTGLDDLIARSIAEGHE
jgi:uncharacterized Ntn-hydrolase superfamily protein